jgi:hypothetical protein
MEALTVFLWIVVAGTVLYFLFTDPVSFILFGLLLAILGYVLVYFGFISAKTFPGLLDITYRPTPTPSESSANGVPRGRDLSGLPEVFNIASNMFTYDEAPAVCKAYGAELATYSQIEEAYIKGAEWCGYGWSAGGMALFPTQEASWLARQSEVDREKREACGRPGINGGYFKPDMRFGVNCFGVRPPEGKNREPVDREFTRSVNRLKRMLDKLAIYPFNSKEWSEHNIRSSETDTSGVGEVGQGVEKVGQGVGGIFDILRGFIDILSPR